MTVHGESACADFIESRAGGCRLLVRNGFHSERLARLLCEGEEALGQQYDLRQVKSAASARVYRFTLEDQGQTTPVYFKEYLDRSIWDVLKHMVRASRARRAFRASLMLTRRGFRAPQVLALGETRAWLVTRRSFLLTRDVTESVRVSDYLVGNKPPLTPDALRRRRALIRVLGQTVGDMHRQGIVHGDLRLGNVLARREDDHWRLFFLDNERTRRFPWLPPWLRLKNLVQVNMLSRGVTNTDRVRFFRAYLAACPDLRPHDRRWAARVQARTRKRQS